MNLNRLCQKNKMKKDYHKPEICTSKNNFQKKASDYYHSNKYSNCSSNKDLKLIKCQDNHLHNKEILKCFSKNVTNSTNRKSNIDSIIKYDFNVKKEMTSMYKKLKSISINKSLKYSNSDSSLKNNFFSEKNSPISGPNIGKLKKIESMKCNNLFEISKQRFKRFDKSIEIIKYEIEKANCTFKPKIINKYENFNSKFRSSNENCDFTKGKSKIQNNKIKHFAFNITIPSNKIRLAKRIKLNIDSIKKNPNKSKKKIRV